MRELVWSPAFTRQLKRLIRQNPQMRKVVEETLQQLTDDLFYSILRTHKLKGQLEGKWSCSIDYSYRIVFKLIENNV
ncbi:MAG TPA: plasmid stabilization protein [Cyanothece sp. UBA12306]|nr:plasmid stabilization protein [Cyanothece sp. UBA12306]